MIGQNFSKCLILRQLSDQLCLSYLVITGVCQSDVLQNKLVRAQFRHLTLQVCVFLLKFLQPTRIERKLPASLYIAIIFSGGVSTWIL
jgi:hypothetical protein